LANLLLQLPTRLLHPIAAHYRPTIVGSLVDPTVKESRVKELESNLKRREVPADMEFWTKVAAQERIREVVLNGSSPPILTTRWEMGLTYRTSGNHPPTGFDSICERIVYRWIHEIILLQFSKVPKVVEGEKEECLASRLD